VRVLASSTPDALWRAPTARAVQPAAVSCRDVSAGRLLARCSFRFAPGVRVLVVAEPDAAGSLLLRVLAGLVRPSRGRVVVAGIEGADAARHGGRVAYVGREPGIHPWMTPREALDLAAGLLDLPRSEAEERVAGAADRAGIAAHDLGRAIRRGRPDLPQRTAFAVALLGDPEVLLLDEPLGDLAPDERSRLLVLPGARRTIIVATARPEELAASATHVMLIRGGRVAALASTNELAAAGLAPTREGLETLAERQLRARG
jgi:ABC-type multidrug transport system ATPase subunit